jgi:hypothetical protein
MEQDRSEKWLPILFFSAMGGVFLFFAYYLTANASDTDAYASPMEGTRLAEVQMIPQDAVSFTLNRDREIEMNGKRFVYRGMQDRSILIEVTIPALDPETVYRYLVPLHRAEKGFNLSGSYFRLKSARQSRIQILRMDPADLC